uniref:Uncharacterized protein n=1 Tax=Melopsittacus undulatus TaxID=13146 RepID=A0A8C6JM66_MELUD
MVADGASAPVSTRWGWAAPLGAPGCPSAKEAEQRGCVTVSLVPTSQLAELRQLCSPASPRAGLRAGWGEGWPPAACELFQFIVYIPVLSLGIPLNAIAFWVFCCRLKRWTETRVYMINLIVAGSFLLFALPFLIHFTMYEHPIDNLCFTIQRIYFTNMPMTSIRGALWIIVIIYSYLHLQFYDKKEKFCFRKQSTQPSYTSLVSVIFGCFIPLLIVTFCSVQVIRCLKKKMVTSPQETKLIQKAIRIISMNLCMFTVCFAPFYIALLLRFAVDVAGACSLLSEVNACVHILTCLANSNCCLDAFCYYFAAKEFQEFPPLFPTRLSMRCKMNQIQESQSPTDQVMT